MGKKDKNKDKDSVISNDVENARIGYQTAIELWAHSGDEVWARFNVMLVANSIIIAIIGFLLTADQIPIAIAIILPIVGIILCILWVIMMKRGFDYQLYYLLAARELEEMYLLEPIQTISRGGIYASGEEIYLTLDGKKSSFRMSFWSRFLRAHIASYLVVILFILVYISLLVFT